MTERTTLRLSRWPRAALWLKCALLLTACASAKVVRLPRGKEGALIVTVPAE